MLMTDILQQLWLPLTPTLAPQLEFTPPSPPAWKKLRKTRRHNAMIYYWYLVTACFMALIIMRMIYRLSSRQRRRLPKMPLFWIRLSVYPLKLPCTIPITTTKLLVVVGYCTVTTALTLHASYFGGVLDYANPSAMLAVAQLPLIVGLVGRNNVLATLTGASYDHINYVHRTAGRVCFAGTLAHTIGWLIRGLGKHAWTWRIYTAIPAMGGLAALALLSFRRFRHCHHQLFRDTHIVAAVIFLVMTWFHTPEYRSWVWPALAIWCLDRVVGILRIMCASIVTRGAQTATIQRIDDDLLLISIPVPFKWRPGTHAYLCMPTIAKLPWEQHPFTFANVPCDREISNATFVVRAHGGFTRRLADASKTALQQVPVYVEGPYGEPQVVKHTDHLLLFAGGSGVTLCLAYLIDATSRKRCIRGLQRVRLVWNVRRMGHIRAIASLLEEALASMTNANVSIRVDIHATRTSASSEPIYWEDDECVPPSEHPLDASPARSHSSLDSLDENGGLFTVGESNQIGLGPATKAHTILHRGRSQITSTLREEANDLPFLGNMCVIVCGPPSLTLDAGQAVSKIASETATEISLHCGSFQL